MTKKSVLVEELLGKINISRLISPRDSIEQVADFILAREKRLMGPLKVIYTPGFPNMTLNGQLNTMWESIEQTLKLSNEE